MTFNEVSPGRWVSSDGVWEILEIRGGVFRLTHLIPDPVRAGEFQSRVEAEMWAKKIAPLVKKGKP